MLYFTYCHYFLVPIYPLFPPLPPFFSQCASGTCGVSPDTRGPCAPLMEVGYLPSHCWLAAYGLSTRVGGLEVRDCTNWLPWWLMHGDMAVFFLFASQPYQALRVRCHWSSALLTPPSIHIYVEGGRVFLPSHLTSWEGYMPCNLILPIGRAMMRCIAFMPSRVPVGRVPPHAATQGTSVLASGHYGFDNGGNYPHLSDSQVRLVLHSPHY